MAKYISTKTYGTEIGLSCCFRQWRSTHSHCSLLHGYSIGVRVHFESETLDDRNWVMDFGGLKAFKAWLEYMFDHTLVIAKDDPYFDTFLEMSKLGLQDQGGVCDMRVVDAVGCEKFSEAAFKELHNIIQTFQRGSTYYLKDQAGNTLKEFNCRYPVGQGVKLRSVEVFEHGANSAIYEGNA
jgi:6-pyruvoyltetrahydropterin/6-carboxytetrahydropterin synthase